MARVPSEYEGMIAAAQAALAEVSQQKKPGAVLIMMYERLIQMFVNSGADPAEFNPYYNLYLASNMAKVLKRVQGIAKSYPPTKRKGVGEDGGIVRLQSGEWIFPHDGNNGSPVGGDGDSDPDEGPDIPTGGLDWAPASEEARARQMLQDVAKEMGFGPGDEALPFIREVAKRLGGRWGLNGKRGNASDPSRDLLAWNMPGTLPQCWDVLQDEGGRNNIVWQALPWGGKSVWLAP
jgi:hypothetical protein